MLLSLLDSMGYSGVVFCLAQHSTTPQRTTVSTCSIPVCPLGCEVHTVLYGATSGGQCIMDNGHMAYQNVTPGFSKRRGAFYHEAGHQPILWPIFVRNCIQKMFVLKSLAYLGLLCC